MKIQQIERSRTGRQGMDAGFRITGSSSGITDAIRQDISGLYTTLSIQQYPMEMPYVLDFGGGRIREYIYFTHVLSSIDACGRRSPYIHSYVIKKCDLERCCKTAEERVTLLRYLNDRINWKSCGGRLQADSSKVILPEIELKSETESECGLETHLQRESECGLELQSETELVSKSKHEIDYIREIQDRYGMTDETIRNLMASIRKTVKTPGLSMKIPMNYSKGNPLDKLLDFMYLVYSCTPPESWNNISFCSYHLKGMRKRDFSL